MKHYCVLGNKRGDLICCWSQKTCKHLIIQHSEEKTDIFNIVHIVCEVVHRFFTMVYSKPYIKHIYFAVLPVVGPSLHRKRKERTCYTQRGNKLDLRFCFFIIDIHNLTFFDIITVIEKIFFFQYSRSFHCSV